MSVFVRFGNGCMTFGRGLAFLYQHSLWGFVVLPCLVSLVVGVSVWCGIYFGFDYLAGIGTTLLTDGALQIENPVLLTVIDWTARILGAVVGLILTLVLFRFLLSIAVLPFLGPLLEQIELIVLGRKIETTGRQDFQNAFYGVVSSIKHSLAGLAILVVSLFLGPFNVPVNAIAQSYFLGRGPFDLLFEKAAADRADRRRLQKGWRVEIFGTGFVFFLVLFLPVIGVLFAPVCVVTGAALLYYSPDSRRAT